jgi:hypothetical protein
MASDPAASSPSTSSKLEDQNQQVKDNSTENKPNEGEAVNTPKYSLDSEWNLQN